MSEMRDSEEDPRSRAEEEARSLLGNAARVREEIGGRRWTAAKRLLVIERVVLGACTVAFFAGFILLLQIGGDWVGRRVDSRHYLDHPGWVKHAPLYLAIDVGMLVLLFVAGLVVTQRLRRRVEEAAEEDPERAEVIWEALTAKGRARELKEEADAKVDDNRDRRQFEADGIGEKPWWLVELSGAHLLWWVSFIGLVVLMWEDPAVNGEASDRLLCIVASVALTGSILKGIIPLFLLGKSNNEARKGIDRRDAVRYYRWWGKGWLPVVVALLPAASWWAGQAVG